MKFNATLSKNVKRILKGNLIPMLIGEPGIGKSSWIMDLANEMHTKCFVLPCNQLAEKADLTGTRLMPLTKTIENPDGTTSEIIVDYEQRFFPHEIIAAAIRYAEENDREEPILFLDEINRTTPDVTSALLSFSTTRVIAKREIPKNLKLITAGNDKGNVIALDKASITRFAPINVEPDTNTFLALDPDLNINIKNVLNRKPELIYCETRKLEIEDNNHDPADLSIEDLLDEGSDMRQVTTPRTISGLSTFLNSLSESDLLELHSETYLVNGEETSALEEMVVAHVGETSFKDHLMLEIAENMFQSAQSTVLILSKPQSFDDLKNASTVDEINKMVAEMNENERSANLLYAMYEKENNDVIINAIANQLENFTKRDIQIMMRLLNADNLDRHNTDAFVATDTPIARKISGILIR